MKHYFSFIILFATLVIAYFFASYFDNNTHFSVPHIVSIEMPSFEKNSKDMKSSINMAAFKNSDNLFNPNYVKENVHNLTINMIYVGETSKSCTINGFTFREGEYHNNIKVVRIEKNRVLVKVNKKLKWLNLKVVANEKS